MRYLFQHSSEGSTHWHAYSVLAAQYLFAHSTRWLGVEFLGSSFGPAHSQVATIWPVLSQPRHRICNFAYSFIIDNISDGPLSDLSSFAVVSQLRVTRGFGLEGADHPEAMVPIGGRSESTMSRIVRVIAWPPTHIYRVKNWLMIQGSCFLSQISWNYACWWYKTIRQGFVVTWCECAISCMSVWFCECMAKSCCYTIWVHKPKYRHEVLRRTCSLRFKLHVVVSMLWLSLGEEDNQKR